jgi:hypothetical protein
MKARILSWLLGRSRAEHAWETASLETRLWLAAMGATMNRGAMR